MSSSKEELCNKVRSADEHRKSVHVASWPPKKISFVGDLLQYRTGHARETIELNNTRYFVRCLFCPSAGIRYPTKPVFESNTGSAGHESMEKDNKESATALRSNRSSLCGVGKSSLCLLR